MVEEILPGLFRLRMPLPGPLGFLNSYLIRGDRQAVLVDTGINTSEAWDELQLQLGRVGLEPGSLTEVVLTHFHIDHVGLIPKLRSKSNVKLALHVIEAELSERIAFSFNAMWAQIASFLKANGVPTLLLKQMRKANPGANNSEVYAYLAKADHRFKGGETLNVDEYRFKIIWTPGHSPGHLCLYEAEKQILIAGDSLLPSITPNVTQVREGVNALASYLKSLKELERLKVSLVLPAHGEPYTDSRLRIRQLKEHHQRRLEEVLNLVQRPSTAYHVASMIRWDAPYRSWEEFPPLQKYLAVAEAIAHLELLRERGMVNIVRKTGINHYVIA
ncbi:MAG: MBL fold metallo-hydrolase [Candidatus Nezhaarchaeales archaeon]